MTAFAIPFVLVAVMTMDGRAENPPPADGRYAIAIHGGAGGWKSLTPEKHASVEQVLKTALRAGRDRLADGESSLAAVEASIRVLEDSPIFNAGRGAVSNDAGQHQLDASIMNGKDRNAGAVASITVAKNPITVARHVMTETRHVLLGGEGADAFARRVGADLVEPDYFLTSRADTSGSLTSHDEPREDHYGTVGCVALDSHGNLAAGTSTGGLQDKMVGRIGDSPLIAAGTYADNETCAVSGTGVGELYIRHAIAYDVSARLRYVNQPLDEAVRYQINERLEPGTGGLIAVGHDGTVVAEFNTRAMPRGIADSDGRFDVAILSDDGGETAQ